jgi:hypothetical protein
VEAVLRSGGFQNRLKALKALSERKALDHISIQQESSSKPHQQCQAGLPEGHDGLKRWQHAREKPLSCATTATAKSNTRAGRQEMSSPEGDDMGFWRAVCAERCKHGSEGGQRNTVRLCAPLLPYFRSWDRRHNRLCLRCRQVLSTQPSDEVRHAVPPRRRLTPDT